MVIAVGNAVLLKPSELAVNTSNVLMELIPQYMDSVSSYDYVFVSVCLSVCLSVSMCCVYVYVCVCVTMSPPLLYRSPLSETIHTTCKQYYYILPLYNTIQYIETLYHNPLGMLRNSRRRHTTSSGSA